MGSAFGQPQLSAQNYVLDYQCNLLNPRYRQIFQRLGPNAGAFPEQGKGQILNEMQECITNADPALLAEYFRLQHTLWGFYAIMLFCLVLFIGLIFVYASVGGPLLVLGIIGGIVGTCIFSRRLNVAGHQWRGCVLGALQSKLQYWKAQYPAFTFTIIYPMEVWRRGGNRGHSRLVAIWMYLRITQGLCQTGRNEPIFASSGMAPVQQTTTTTQVVIQQPMQVQTVMVQGANGQMVPARYALVNGQQVLVVDQPPPQQYIQQQQQQYIQQPTGQYQGQPQQQYTQPPYNPEGR